MSWGEGSNPLASAAFPFWGLMRHVSLNAEPGQDAVGSYLSPAVPTSRMIANMRANLDLGLPLATLCKPHRHVMSVAGGGPSLADTYGELEGFICAVNGSLQWLLDHGPKEGCSYACGVMDAGVHIPDALIADPNVRYYVASIVDPGVLQKLKGCDVRLWHVTPNSTEDEAGVMAVLDEIYGGEWQAIGGGCTMGLRWIDLGYYLGFRKFALHGLDSCFKNVRSENGELKNSTHAYPDRADGKDTIQFDGRTTRLNFLAQVYDFAQLLERLWVQDTNIQIRMHGDGLIQNEWAEFRKTNPDAFLWQY